MIKAKPIELRDANNFIEKLHRHHAPVHRDKFRLAAVDDNNIIHGVVQLGRPVARYLNDGYTIEVVRLCSDGTPNVCSFLYSRAARIAKEMGYKKIITYILESETGSSLKASGWSKEEDNAGGGSWDRPSRPRELVCQQLSLFGDNKPKYNTEKKQRWSKSL